MRNNKIDSLLTGNFYLCIKNLYMSHDKEKKNPRFIKGRLYKAFSANSLISENGTSHVVSNPSSIQTGWLPRFIEVDVNPFIEKHCEISLNQ